MTTPPPATPWPRPHYRASALPMKMHFVCFAKQALDLPPMRAVDYGVVPGDALQAIDVTRHARDGAEEWFAGWWDNAFGEFAHMQLGAEFKTLTQTTVCYSVQLRLDDHADLSPLQAAWGVVRWLVDCGAGFVLDLHALKYRTGDDVREFDFGALKIGREISIANETSPTDDTGTYLIHTRGMTKFARPDLMFFRAPTIKVKTAGQMLNALALKLAEGALPEDLNDPKVSGAPITLRPFEDAALLAQLGIDCAWAITL